MDKKTVITVGAETLQTIYEYTEKSNYLTNSWLERLDGWDTATTTEIETLPKLLGEGSYLISQKHNERILSISWNITNNVGETHRKFLETQKNFSELTISRIYTEDGTEKRKEVLKGYITSVNNFQNLNKESAIIEIVVKCLNPFKEVYLNGSPTAEATGTL